MDDEEYTYSAMQEPLYRVETGNYEYRYYKSFFICANFQTNKIFKWGFDKKIIIV